MASKEPTEAQLHARAEAAAAVARDRVAGQIAEGLAERSMVGDSAVVGMRVLDLATARRTRDPEAVRAAMMELCLAAAEAVVAMDLRYPHVSRS